MPQTRITPIHDLMLIIKRLVFQLGVEKLHFRKGENLSMLFARFFCRFQSVYKELRLNVEVKYVAKITEKFNLSDPS
jgi:hypothetical protein